MTEQTSIEKELLKATAIKNIKKMARPAQLSAIMEASRDLPDKAWDALSTAAQTWVNSAVTATNAEEGIVEFEEPADDASGEDEEDDAVEDDESEDDIEGTEPDEDEDGEDEDEPPPKAKAKAKSRAKAPAEEDDDDEDEPDADEDGEEDGDDDVTETPAKKTAPKKAPAKKAKAPPPKKSTSNTPSGGKPKAVADKAPPAPKKAVKADKSERKAPATRELDGEGAKVKIKRAIMENPTASVEEIMKKLGKSGPTKLTVSSIRAEFRHSLKFLMLDGHLKTKVTF